MQPPTPSLQELVQAHMGNFFEFDFEKLGGVQVRFSDDITSAPLVCFKGCSPSLPLVVMTATLELTGHGAHIPVGACYWQLCLIILTHTVFINI